METWANHPAPHTLPLHVLRIGHSIPSKESEVPVYAWALDNSAKQAPLTVHVEPLLLLPVEDIVTINKVAMVNFLLQNEDTSDSSLAFDKSAAINKLWATRWSISTDAS